MKGIFYPSWKLLSSRTEILSLRDVLLKQRNLNDSQSIQAFFETEYPKGIHNPELLKDYNKAIHRILEAIEKKERIIIFGDYDVDGTVGTSILVEILQNVGAKVSYRIPHRKKDGYGLKKYLIDEIATQNVALIITVDNGISAVEEVQHAKNLGIDVIITDHHLPQETTPPAFAIVNHKQTDCDYPYPEICGAALAYKIALGLAKHFFSQEQYESYARKKLDLVALATVADCMPLLDENRILVKEGLKVLKETNNPGLLALQDVGKISYENANADTFGFQLGPRINAGGRIGQAYFGLQLLLGKTEHAQILEDLNQQRKTLVEEALQDIQTRSLHNAILIESSPDWHAGIVGLIAGKLTEKYHLPSIIFEEQESIAIASCRAPNGFDIFSFLQEFQHFFLHFGGHEQAAGLSMKKENISLFKREAELRALQILQTTPIEKSLSLNTELFIEDLNVSLIRGLEDFEPFGIGNEKPIFLLRNIEKIQWRQIGKKNEHLSGSFIGPQGEIRILKFFGGNLYDQLIKNSKIHIACTLSKNVWNNKEFLQLELVDISFV